eukprot:scaffold22772_cov130-Cylindrotheca_fusiformis.AAC.1
MSVVSDCIARATRAILLWKYELELSHERPCLAIRSSSSSDGAGNDGYHNSQPLENVVGGPGQATDYEPGVLGKHYTTDSYCDGLDSLIDLCMPPKRQEICYCVSAPQRRVL